MIKLPVIAWSSAGERNALSQAFEELLPAAFDDVALKTDLIVAARADEVIEAAPETLRIVSLVPFALDEGTAWDDMAQQLHTLFQALAETGDPVFVMTVFRFVTDRASPAGRALVLRIRRLNLLATELSRAYGAFVVDIDRALADVGAVGLGADYLLGSSAAARFAGRELAQTVIVNGMDAFAPIKAQEQARQRLLAAPMPVEPIVNLSPAELTALGRGRHRQLAAVNIDSVQENHVRWLVEQVLKRRIGLGEALGRVSSAMRRRGARQSLGLLFGGVRHQIARKGSAR